MKLPNTNALSAYFAEKTDKLLVLRYTFSLKDDEGKEKICCELICGNLGRHEYFLENLSSKAIRGFVQYVCEFDTSLLYEEVQNIFLPEEEEKKEGDE